MSSSISTRRSARTQLKGPRRSRVSRWVAAFVAVAALHWLAAQWFVRHRDIVQPAPPTHIPVQVALLKPQQIERSAPPPAGAVAKRPAPHTAAPKPHSPPPHTLSAIAREPQPKVPATPEASAPEQAASAAVQTPVQAPVQAPVAASAPTATSGANGTQQAQANGTGDHPGAPPGTASHGVKFSVPPSGDLSYDTFYNGMRNQPGTIHWSSDGQHYEMIVSVPLPFIGTFSWTSRGRVDAFGLAPDTYTEKRGHRAEDVTTFNRDSKQIAFTRTPNDVPLPDGAQDRFSMVMQLASLVRGDPDAYKPGVTREFFVADNDSGETWPVTTIGDESVNTDHGFVSARHFMRLPRREGDRRRIDVWLAPSLGWLPVRLVQTEPNGTQFELVWRGPLTLPSAPAAASDANAAAPASSQNQRATAAGFDDSGNATGTTNTTGNQAPANGAANDNANDRSLPAPTSSTPPASPDAASPPGVQTGAQQGVQPGVQPGAQSPAEQPAAPPAGGAASATPETTPLTAPIEPLDPSVKP